MVLFSQVPLSCSANERADKLQETEAHIAPSVFEFGDSIHVIEAD